MDRAESPDRDFRPSFSEGPGQGRKTAVGAVIVTVEDDCGAVRILKALFGLKGKAERLAGDDAVTEGTETVIQIGLQD